MDIETLTHVSGPAIHIGSRIIQRCSICGTKLCDNIHAAMPINPDGSIQSFPTWEPGRLIRITIDTNPTEYILLEDTDKLPDDSCLALVET